MRTRAVTAYASEKEIKIKIKINDRQRREKPHKFSHLLFEKKAVIGLTKIFTSGGKVPNVVRLCNSVDKRLDCTDTRLPPTPLITGWKTASPLYVDTIKSKMKPPNL